MENCKDMNMKSYGNATLICCSTNKTFYIPKKIHTFVLELSAVEYLHLLQLRNIYTTFKSEAETDENEFAGVDMISELIEQRGGFSEDPNGSNQELREINNKLGVLSFAKGMSIHGDDIRAIHNTCLPALTYFVTATSSDWSFIVSEYKDDTILGSVLGNIGELLKSTYINNEASGYQYHVPYIDLLIPDGFLFRDTVINELTAHTVSKWLTADGNHMNMFNCTDAQIIENAHADVKSEHLAHAIPHESIYTISTARGNITDALVSNNHEVSIGRYKYWESLGHNRTMCYLN